MNIATCFIHNNAETVCHYIPFDVQWWRIFLYSRQQTTYFKRITSLAWIPS